MTYKKALLKIYIHHIFSFRVLLFVFLSILFLCFTSNAAPGIYETINFQAKIVELDGTNSQATCGNSCNFDFRIYDSSSGGSLLWSEVQNNVPVQNGIINVKLGSINPFSTSIDFNDDSLYLEIAMDADDAGGTFEEVFDNPRLRFSSVPYAFNSKQVGGIEASGFLLSDQSDTYEGSNDQTLTMESSLSEGDRTSEVLNIIQQNDGANLMSSELVSIEQQDTDSTGDVVFIENLGNGDSLQINDENSDATPFVLDSNGNVGIQNSTPNASLDVSNGTTFNNILNLQDDTSDVFSVLDGGNVVFYNNEAEQFRLENLGAAPTCDASSVGREFYDSSNGAGFICIESSPSVYTWFDFTASYTTTSSKVVTVGTDGNYTTIAAAAAYLNGLTGGIILLTPETHIVDSSVDLEDITLIGANTFDTTISITGSGVLNVKETQFKSLTLEIDSAITSDSGLDTKYDASTTSSVIFEWVDFQIGGTKVLIDSSATTAPVIRTRFISTKATAGNNQILFPQASSNIDFTSTHFIESMGGDGPLDFGDWDVEIAGSSNVVTSGTVSTVPDNTIYVYPGMSIQSAINSLPNGGVINLLPGAHDITEPIIINYDDIEIAGYADSTILRAAGFPSTVDTVAALQIGAADGSSPVNNVVLRNFKVEVNGPNIHGVRATGGSDNQLYNLTVQKTSGAGGSAGTARVGIQFIDATTDQLIRPVIKNCRVLGNGAGNYFTDGIHVSSDGDIGGVWGNDQGVENALIEGNNIDYVRETAAVFVGVENSSLFNNRFSRMGVGGGGAYGVYIGNSSKVNINGNIVSGSLSTNSIAIGVESFNVGSLKSTLNSIFIANVIDGEGNGGVGFGTGFQIGGAFNTEIDGTTFQSNKILGASTAPTTVAMDISGEFDDNIISNNTISGGTNSWDTAISINDAAADRNKLDGNVTVNVTTPINDLGTDTQIGVMYHRSDIDPTVDDDINLGYSIGSIWIDTIDDESYICVDDTDGAAVWNQIDGGSTSGAISSIELPAVQVRRTSDFTLTNVSTWYDIPFDITDVETNSAILEHNNTNNDRIDIKAEGLYEITYQVNANDTGVTHQLESRVRINDSSVVDGSYLVNRNYQNEYVPTTATFIVELDSGDYINLQAMRTTTNTIINETLLTITKLDGVSATGATAVVGQFFDTTGSQNLNVTTPVAIQWDNETRKDFGITHSNTTNNSRVYLDTQGWYKVSYSVSHENQANNRMKNIRCRVRRNGTTYISPSDSYSISYDDTDEWATNTATFMFETTADDVYYEVMCNGEGEDVDGSAANTVSNQSWTEIEKIGGVPSSPVDLDEAYLNDLDKVLGISNGAGLEFESSSTGNVVFDLQSTGDFVLQDNNTSFLTVSDDGGFDYTLDGTDNPSFTITNEGTGSIIFNDEAGDTTPVEIDADGNFTIGSLANCDLIYTDATGQMQCGTDVGAIWDAYDNSGGQTLNPGPITINIDTERRSNTNYSLTADVVSVNSDGIYEVGFSCSLDAGGGRTNGRCWLEKDTGSGFTEEDGSSCYTYNRNTSNGETTCTRSVVLDLSNGDEIRLRGEVEAGASLSTIADASSITIKKIIAAGADLAEIYYTEDESIEAGDVLSIDGTIEAGVKKSKVEYEDSLIGVVSTKPAEVIGNDGKEKEGRPVLVALSGRVPVKVLPDSDPIKAGDYITSSSKSGLAMKANKPGIVIGKALENWSPNLDDDMVMIFVGTGFYDPKDGVIYQDILPAVAGEYNKDKGEFTGGINIGSKEKSFNNVYANQYYSDSSNIGNRNLSEKYKILDDSISAGDVVAPIYGSGIILDKTNSSYQSSVIGVISSNPGITLSDLIEEEDQVDKMRPVALAGRVPVKVTTENGPIEKGDRLVPSSKPGYAMKQCGDKTCKPSIIIGIALEDFDKNTSGDTEEVSSELRVREKVLMAEIEELKDQKTSELQEELYSYSNEFNNIDGSIQDDIEEIEKVEQVVNQLTKPIEEVEHTSLGEGRVMMFVNLSYVGTLEDQDTHSFNQVPTVMGDNIQAALSGDEIQGNVLGNIIVEELHVLGDAVFDGDVAIKGEVSLGRDSVGRAVIKKGDKVIKIKFENEYLYEPIITVTPIEFVGKYKLLDISKEGFSIQLERSYRFDVRFNWHSFSSRAVNTSYSESQHEMNTDSENEEIVIINVDDNSNNETTSINQDINKQSNEIINSPVESGLDSETEGADKSDQQVESEIIGSNKKIELEEVTNDLEYENDNIVENEEEIQIDETISANETEESYEVEQPDNIENME